MNVVVGLGSTILFLLGIAIIATVGTEWSWFGRLFALVIYCAVLSYVTHIIWKALDLQD